MLSACQIAIRTTQDEELVAARLAAGRRRGSDHSSARPSSAALSQDGHVLSTDALLARAVSRRRRAPHAPARLWRAALPVTDILRQQTIIGRTRCSNGAIGLAAALLVGDRGWARPHRRQQPGDRGHLRDAGADADLHARLRRRGCRLLQEGGPEGHHRNLVGVASPNAVLAGSADFTMGTGPVFLRAAAQGQRIWRSPIWSTGRWSSWCCARTWPTRPGSPTRRRSPSAPRR